MECRVLWHIIWVFTVSHITPLIKVSSNTKGLRCTMQIYKKISNKFVIVVKELKNKLNRFKPEPQLPTKIACFFIKNARCTGYIYKNTFSIGQSNIIISNVERKYNVIHRHDMSFLAIEMHFCFLKKSYYTRLKGPRRVKDRGRW